VIGFTTAGESRAFAVECVLGGFCRLDDRVVVWNPEGTPILHHLPDLVSVDGQSPLTVWSRVWLPGKPTPSERVPVPPKSGTDRRREVLATIEGCVCKDRQNTYSDAEDNFADIAQLWTFWLRKRGLIAKDATVDALDVAMMSALIKVARASVNPTYLDNWVDFSGYGVCGGGIVKSREAK
jgi:Domain of unknown function (DUF6378)